MKKAILTFTICLIINSTFTVNAQNQKDSLKDSSLVGIWIFERSLIDNNGNKITVYPGNFMKIDSDGSFSFFLYTPQGGFIVNEGTITLESDEVYIEKIKYNTDPSYIGKEIKQKFRIENKRLHKTRFEDKNNQTTEVWRRVERPDGFLNK